MRTTGGLFAIIMLLAIASAQDGKPAAEKTVPFQEVHLGAGSCAAQACHGGGFAERMEYKVWATKDPHSGAFTSLGSELGKRIGARLKVEPTTSERCLNCHGTIGVETADTFDQADGVSCELCHGGAKEWLGPHVEEKWRAQTPEKKELVGLKDLTTPRKRAQLCATCHVAAVGKEIGHDIMAAGHPPLIFDAAKQMRDMHPHWKDDRDHTLETWAEGLREGAAAELSRIARAAREKREWMEFAVFDCYACHHPIYQGTAYERRVPKNKPGALPLDLATLRVLIRLTNDNRLREGCSKVLERSVLPTEDARTLAGEAEAAAKLLSQKQLGAIGLESEPRLLAEKWLKNVAAWLTDKKIAETPPHVMQQIAMAVDVLVPNREADGYRDAYAAFLRSVDPKQSYDAQNSATLGLKAIEAGR
ncbi:MAG: multiheme c-type cytochrome [Planctomycetota bacterium]